MRPLSDIAAEITALEKRLEALHVERGNAVEARRLAIIKAFDDGATRKELCEAFPELTYSGIGTILHVAGRSEEFRLRLNLKGSQRPHFDKLRKNKVPKRVAAQIAETIG